MKANTFGCFKSINTDHKNGRHHYKKKAKYMSNNKIYKIDNRLCM